MATKLIDKTTEIISESGVTVTRETTEQKVKTEPNHFKIYIDNDILFKASGTAIKILLYISELISYADITDLYGGMTFRLGVSDKDELMRKLDISKAQLYRCLKELKELNLIKKLDNEYFQVNPNVIGKGFYYYHKNIKKGAVDEIRKMWNENKFYKHLNPVVADEKTETLTEQSIREKIEYNKSKMLDSNTSQDEKERLSAENAKLRNTIDNIQRSTSYELKKEEDSTEESVTHDTEAIVYDVEDIVSDILDSTTEQPTEASKQDSEQLLLEESIISTYKTNEDGFMTEIETNEADPF